MKTLWLKDSNISLPGVSMPGGGGGEGGVLLGILGWYLRPGSPNT